MFISAGDITLISFNFPPQGLWRLDPGMQGLRRSDPRPSGVPAHPGPEGRPLLPADQHHLRPAFLPGLHALDARPVDLGLQGADEPDHLVCGRVQRLRVGPL